MRYFLAELAVAVADCEQVLEIRRYHVRVQNERILVLFLWVVWDVACPCRICIFSNDVLFEYLRIEIH